MSGFSSGSPAPYSGVDTQGPGGMPSPSPAYSPSAPSQTPERPGDGGQEPESPASPQNPHGMMSWASVVSGPATRPDGRPVDLRTHPSGLPYCDLRRLDDKFRDVLMKNSAAILWAGPVVKLGKRSHRKQKRFLFISATAVYQYTPGQEVINRNVPVNDIAEIITQGRWLGLVCPTQYDILVEFESEDTVREVVHVIKTLSKYVRNFMISDRRQSLSEIAKMKGQPIHKSLSLGKPSNWYSRQIPFVKIPSRQKVVDELNEHLERVKDRESAAGDNGTDANSAEAKDEDDADSTAEAALTRQNSPPHSVEDVRRQSTFEAPSAAGDLETRAQMEADYESLVLAASEADKKAAILKIREGQLESQLAALRKKAVDAEARIQSLTASQMSLEAANDMLKRERDHYASERERACEELDVDPHSEVSLTEAARRLTANHGSLTDANWRLTKQIAEVEKKYDTLLAENRAGVDHARLRNDADALKDLIDLRSAEMKASDSQRQDSRTITNLSKQLHTERQLHEETKLSLFDLQQRYNSLANRFRETTASSKARIRKLERKLQAISEGAPPEDVLGDNRPRFSVAFSDTRSQRAGSPRGVTAGCPRSTDFGSMERSASAEPMPRRASRSFGGLAEHEPCTPDGHVVGHAHPQPADVAVGDKVVVSRLEGIVRGVVKYIGRLHGRGGEWIGVELDEPRQDGHNGTYEKRQYFECGAERGLFVRPHNIAVESVACGTCEVRRNAAAMTKAAGRSRSASPNRQAPPPAYRAPPSPAQSEYIDLAVSLQEKLRETEEKLKQSEQLLSRGPTSMPPHHDTPKPVPAPPSPMPSSIASPPPMYRSVSASQAPPTSVVPSTRRDRSRDRSASPSVPPPNPYEQAMRQALSTCVAQLDKQLPKAQTRPTAGDVRWARTKSKSEC